MAMLVDFTSGKFKIFLNLKIIYCSNLKDESDFIQHYSSIVRLPFFNFSLNFLV